MRDNAKVVGECHDNRHTLVTELAGYRGGDEKRRQEAEQRQQAAAAELSVLH